MTLSPEPQHVLGAAFAGKKRRPKLKLPAATPAPAASAPAEAEAEVEAADCAAAPAELPAADRRVLRLLGFAAPDDASATRRRRQRERRDAAAPSPAAKRSLGKKAAFGMYRLPASNGSASRCHWLVPPQSLVDRLDQETGDLLRRQWLALAASTAAVAAAKSPDPGSGGNASAGGGDCADALAVEAEDQDVQGAGPRRKGSYLSLLQAGWMAQALRPKGWLVPIAEDAVTSFPSCFDAAVGDVDNSAAGVGDSALDERAAVEAQAADNADDKGKPNLLSPVLAKPDAANKSDEGLSVRVEVPSCFDVILVALRSHF